MLLRMRIATFLAPVLLALCAAQAWAVTTTSTSGCTSSEAGIDSTIDFGPSSGPNATDPAGHATYTDPEFNQGSDVGCGGAWLGLSSHTTTIDFDIPIDYFGLAWGTKDTDNTIRFFDGATLLDTFGGGSVGGNLYVNFFAESGEQITRVVLSMPGCCFETDNHSYRLIETAVPVPPALALLGAGVVAVVARRWTAKR